MSELLDDIWLSTFLLFRKSTELNYIVPWHITGILGMCGSIRIKIIICTHSSVTAHVECENRNYGNKNKGT
jgi:hypothetical protein